MYIVKCPLPVVAFMLDGALHLLDMVRNLVLRNTLRSRGNQFVAQALATPQLLDTIALLVNFVLEMILQHFDGLLHGCI